MNCEHCERPLSEVVWSADGSLKSCPNCSTVDGHEHVLWGPQTFGHTTKRANADNPDGIQSWCVLCRGGSVPTSGGRKCSSVGAVVDQRP